MPFSNDSCFTEISVVQLAYCKTVPGLPRSAVPESRYASEGLTSGPFGSAPVVGSGKMNSGNLANAVPQ